MKCFVFLSWLGLLLTSNANACDWQTDPDSTLEFIGSAQGEEFRGRFEQFEARICFQPEDLEKSRFEVDIRVSSADTQNSERDDALRENDFFAVDSFPLAHFLAERFEAKADGSFIAHGRLKLKGHEHSVDLHFQWQRTDEGALLDGTAQLDRTAFGVGSGDWEDADTIAHEVRVETRLRLRSP